MKIEAKAVVSECTVYSLVKFYVIFYLLYRVV